MITIILCVTGIFLILHSLWEIWTLPRRMLEKERSNRRQAELIAERELMTKVKATP